MTTSLPRSPLFFLLAGAATILVPAAVLVIGFYTPVEAQLGIVQKIFYFHVPSAFMMYAGFGIAFLASLAYLFTKDPKNKLKFDEYAAAGAEVGLLFASMVLISGPLWARKSWGTYWTWDPQLTATFMIYLMFWSYMAIRAFAAEGERRRTISAIIAVLAAPNMAFIHWAVTVTHPKILRSASGSLAPSMVYTLLFSLVAISCLFGTLFWLRYRLEKDRNQAASLRERVTVLEDQRPIMASPALLPLFLLLQPAKVEEFVPASAPSAADSLPGGTLLVIAYAAMWAFVVIYVISLWRRQGKVYGEVKELTKQVKTLEPDKKKE